jgi:Domain of unknown function (DUF1707)
VVVTIALGTEGAMASGFEMRVGDAERESAAAELREHYASGRLTLEELNERLDAAFAAKTRADLNAVMRDLPSARPGWSAAGGRASSPAGGQPTGPGEPFGPGGATGPFGPGGAAGPFGPGGAWRHGPAQTVGAIIFSFVALWVLLLLGILGIFGIGVGRPIAIVLLVAALGLLRRLIFRRRAGACGSRRRL